MRREGRQHGIVRSYPIYPNSSSNSKSVINQFNSPPTAGLFTKVSSRPTNHSKFTGKCGKPRCLGCHSHPACKSRDKGKGTYKIRSSDVSLNHRLISWRVGDSKGKNGVNYVGISATEVLGQLSNYYQHDAYDDDEDEDEDDVVEDVYEDGDTSFGFGGEVVMGECHVVKEVEIVNGANEAEEDDDVDDEDVVEDLNAHDVVGDEETSFGLGGEIVMGECHVVEEVGFVNGANDLDDDLDDDDDDDDDDLEDEDEDMGFCDVGFVIEQLDGDDGGWCLVGEL